MQELVNGPGWEIWLENGPLRSVVGLAISSANADDKVRQLSSGAALIIPRLPIIATREKDGSAEGPQGCKHVADLGGIIERNLKEP